MQRAALKRGMFEHNLNRTPVLPPVHMTEEVLPPKHKTGCVGVLSSCVQLWFLQGKRLVPTPENKVYISHSLWCCAERINCRETSTRSGLLPAVFTHELTWTLQDKVWVVTDPDICVLTWSYTAAVVFKPFLSFHTSHVVLLNMY